MQRRCYDVYTSIALSFLVVILSVSMASGNEKPDVDERYERFFVHYVDKRSVLEKALNLVGLSNLDVGRSFALLAGISYYPYLPGDKELNPAKEDLMKLWSYLEEYEFFDEIVVLHNEDMNQDNLRYFLQSYFPARLKKFPKSRFLFAYSGHGFNDGEDSYLLERAARSFEDKENSVNVMNLKVFINEVVKHVDDSDDLVLVLLNACYGGAFLKRPFGDKPLLPKYGGAHAITAGGSQELTWHDPKIGTGSVFFEKLFAGLDERADIYPTHGDGVIQVNELFTYLSQEIQISTDQDQNPQIGDISKHGSRGGFFFLNRRRQVDNGVVSEWDPKKATAMGLETVRLQVAVTPADATVTLAPADAPDRVILPSSPNKYQIEQGYYLLCAQRPGYAPYSREFTLDWESEEILVTLERLMGTLQLQVEPTDARVMVTSLSVAAPDSKIAEPEATKVPPTGGRSFPIGTYRVTAEKEGYESGVRDPVEIRANASTWVMLTLKPKPATIDVPDLPDGTRVFVDGESVALPYVLPPGKHKIRLERDSFESVEVPESPKPGQVLSLHPKWVRTSVHKGITPIKAFAASLVVPGLGQHLQGHHWRGFFYEVAVVSTGTTTLWAAHNYKEKLDHYEDVRTEDAYNEAKSARKLTIATQVALGILLGVNAVDAGIIEPERPSDEVAFEAHPTPDGIQFLVRGPF